MIAKLSLMISFAFLAVATPTPSPSTSQCDTGSIQCCDSVQPAGSTAVAPLLSLLGVVVQDLTVPVGLTCSPISVVGVGSGSTCTADPVCCENNSFNGVVAIGCTPIDASL